MNHKKVAILQSNYIPWKGYFDIINSVDEFILYDNVQYTRRDWRNRNVIKTRDGLKWLTIPVETKGRFEATIQDVRIADKSWNQAHWSFIAQAYAKSPYFNDLKPFFEELYLSRSEDLLSQVNYRFIVSINRWLGIKTKISWSSDYVLVDGKSERLLSLCEQAGANEYLSGPAAQHYLDESLFESAGVKVTWADYSGYLPYSQAHPPFEHGVSMIDLMFNEGPNARKFMKSFREV